MVNDTGLLPKYEEKEKWPELYMEAALEVMRQRKSIDIICLGQGKHRSEKMLASWVPDLRMHPVETPAIPPINCTGQPVFRASSRSLFSGGLSGKIELYVFGIRAARIKLTSVVHTLQQTGIPQSLLMASGPGGVLRDMPYLHKLEHTRNVAMARTLCFDINYNGKRCERGDTFAERGPYTLPPADFRPELLHRPQERADHFERQMTVAAGVYRNMRRFAVSDEDHFAMVPPEAEVGDWLAVLEGASVPMVLRQAPARSSEYTFIGEWYALCLMLSSP